MTIERAAEIAYRFPRLVGSIQNAIDAILVAVAEEREECARIAEKASRCTYEANVGRVAASIARDIRNLSNAR